MAIIYIHPRIVEQQVCLWSWARKMCAYIYMYTHVYIYIKHSHIHTDVYLV